MDLKRILSILSVPDEVVYNLPYITAVGNREVIIENYIGIIEYSENKMRIKTSCGTLAVTGDSLSLKNISESEIRICGSIFKWEYS